LRYLQSLQLYGSLVSSNVHFDGYEVGFGVRWLDNRVINDKVRFHVSYGSLSGLVSDSVGTFVTETFVMFEVFLKDILFLTLCNRYLIYLTV